MKHVPGARSIHVGCSPGAAFPHSRGTRAGADMESWHGTTILGVRKNGKVVVAGDGQVSLGQTVIKPNAKKVRRMHDGSAIGGLAGATADALPMFELLERTLEQHHGALFPDAVVRAEERRGRSVCVCQCRSRWSP